MKNNRLVRLIAGLVLLAVFAVLLTLSIKNYDYDKLMQDAQPKTVVVTVEVTVTPDAAAASAVTGKKEEQPAGDAWSEGFGSDVFQADEIDQM